MSKQIVMDRLPECDFAQGEPGHAKARYDCKTRMGPWANLCPEDWPFYRETSKLGTGFGQRLVLESEGERIPDGQDEGPAPW